MTNNHVDVLIVGGGAAGSAAALQLGRIGRSVVVVDSGRPRNAPAKAMHGFIGHDGTPPGEFLEIAHRELAAYGVTMVNDRVKTITAVADESMRFRADRDRGPDIVARRVLLATGLTDTLPDIPGIQEMWGREVIHCPWCHGWETKGSSIVIIDSTGAGWHQALLFSQLRDDIVLVDNGPDGLTDDQRSQLELAGVTIDNRTVTAVTRQHPGVQVVFAEGDPLTVGTVVVGPTFRPNRQMVGPLDLAVTSHPSGLGTHLDVRANGQSTNPGVYAAGNVADPYQQVLHAAADGSRVAIAINADLLDEDLSTLATTRSQAAEWDERYGQYDQRMWSGRANGSLVGLLGDQPPGRLLDVGCGEGADAIWLAEQGWTVTATDISDVAIDRARRAAAEAGVDVEWQAADLATEPPRPGGYDVVTISYPALRRERRKPSLAALTNAVAPGGQLVVIAHANEEPATDQHQNGFDRADYVSIGDIVDHLAEDFTVEVNRVQDRPDPPQGARHTRDHVILARRQPADRQPGDEVGAGTTVGR